MSGVPREPSLEELLDRATEMRLANRATQWALGDIAAEARETFGKQALGKLAEVMGVSTRWVQKLAQVSTAFTHPERAEFREVNWSVFALAATTDTPRGWIVRAADNQWSERELRQAIRGSKPPSNAVERLLHRAETILLAGDDDAEALRDGLLTLMRQIE